MKYFLTIFLCLFIFSANAEDLVIDIRGYYTNDEIVMQNENKLVHYESKGNWNDNLNNYGKFKYSKLFKMWNDASCYMLKM